MPADLLDGTQIHPRLGLIAIDRTWEQHAAHARGMQLRQQWFGNALRAFDRIGGRFDRGAEFTGARERVCNGWGDVVHRALAARAAVTVNVRPARRVVPWV